MGEPSQPWDYARDFESLGAAVESAPVPPMPPLRPPPRGLRPRGSLVLLALALGLAVVAGMWLRGGPESVEPHPAPVVSVVPHGEGQVTRDGAQTSIAWTSGVVAVEVPPDAGAHVEVQTPEATVSVVGTRFTVARDTRGTVVDVQRGVVSVACTATGRERRLRATQTAWCVQHAGGALGVALERVAAGDADARVLEVIAQGLAHPLGQPATRTVLRGLQVQALARLGRDDEALAVARGLLDSGERDALATAVQIALPQGCPEALPFLEALQRLGEPAADRLIAACR